MSGYYRVRLLICRLAGQVAPLASRAINHGAPGSDIFAQHSVRSFIIKAYTDLEIHATVHKFALVSALNIYIYAYPSDNKILTYVHVCFPRWRNAVVSVDTHTHTHTQRERERDREREIYSSRLPAIEIQSWLLTMNLSDIEQECRI